LQAVRASRAAIDTPANVAVLAVFMALTLLGDRRAGGSRGSYCSTPERMQSPGVFGCDR
jgi:hypothetical protein